FLIQVLEEFLPGNRLAARDDARKPPIVHAAGVGLPALPAKLEHDLPALHLDMPVLERGQAERLVGPRVFLVPDAYTGRLEEPDDGREHFLAREPVEREIR